MSFRIEPLSSVGAKCDRFFFFNHTATTEIYTLSLHDALPISLAVVEPISSGLGGGGFYLLHRQSDGYETMLDAREKAPGAASRDMYLDKNGNAIDNASIAGSLASAIPGEPAAFDYLARKYGKLSLKQSLQPAIRLARDGFPLYARLQGGIRYNRQVLARSPDAAKAFLA